MTEPQLLASLADALRHSATGAVVLTGAGVSVASDVPSFRGGSGLWTRYDPDRYATIQAFREDPERVWGFLRELDRLLEAVAPNAAHHALAALERAGLVTHVITQNVDRLHHRAGSARVIELHGSGGTLSCLDCGSSGPRTTLPDSGVPRCDACGGLVKPDVVLFGEEVPLQPFREAEHAVTCTDLLLVVGTSAEVHPAAALPAVARGSGARIWEVNPEPVLEADGTIAGAAEEVLPALVRRLLPRRHWRR